MVENKLFDTSDFAPKNSHKYALALVNIKGLGVRTFSYLIPDEMKLKSDKRFWFLSDVRD